MNDEAGRSRRSLFEPDAAVTDFRVVSNGKERRGIRLERLFWSVLKDAAKRNQTTIAGFVEDVSKQKTESANLASALRVACLSSAVDRTTQLEILTSPAMINSILAAVPSPAFALGTNKKILAFNTAFQTLIRRQFPVVFEGDQRADLKLALDMNITDLTARLDLNGNTPVLSGFAIGLGDRRFRGQLNAMKAPSSGADIVLGFILP